MHQWATFDMHTVLVFRGLNLSLHQGDRMIVERLHAKAVSITLISFAIAVASCGNSPGAGNPGGTAGANAGASGDAGTGVVSGSAGATGTAGSTDSGNGGQVSVVDSGSAGAGASAGVTGGGGASAGTGGGAETGDGGASAGSGAGGGADGGSSRSDFVCTELIGLWVASQWWDTFEKGVDGNKWEFMFQHHGYLEMFADPASPYWSNAVSSKCTMSAAMPDRVVFLPFSLSLNTMDEWVTNLTQVVETMKGKFPGVKRIEVMTTLRSPGNMPCANDTDPNTVVAPYVDQAIQTVADASGGLVTVGPKIELASCSWWAGGTDLTGAGNTGAGQLLAAYYQTH
jgi:hypothetical protein